MTVLVIRAHTRFAVCRAVRVRNGAGRVEHALLVELSLDGCRIGNIDIAGLEADAVLTIAPEGAEAFAATVRWIGERTVGLRLVRPFHTAELDRLIRTCRGELDPPAQACIFAT